jgi:hypothetical protein
MFSFDAKDNKRFSNQIKQNYKFRYLGAGADSIVFLCIPLIQTMEPQVMKILYREQKAKTEIDWYKRINNYQPDMKYLGTTELFSHEIIESNEIYEFISEKILDLQTKMKLKEKLIEKVNQKLLKYYSTLLFISPVSGDAYDYLKKFKKFNVHIIFSYLYTEFINSVLFGFGLTDNHYGNWGIQEVKRTTVYHILKNDGNISTFIFPVEKDVPNFKYQRIDLGDVGFLDKKRENFWKSKKPKVVNFEIRKPRKLGVGAKYDMENLKPQIEYVTTLTEDEKYELYQLNLEQNDEIIMKYKPPLFYVESYGNTPKDILDRDREIRKMNKEGCFSPKHFKRTYNEKGIPDVPFGSLVKESDMRNLETFVDLLDEGMGRLTTKTFYDYMHTYFSAFEIELETAKQNPSTFGDFNTWTHYYGYLENPNKRKNIENKIKNVNSVPQYQSQYLFEIEIDWNDDENDEKLTFEEFLTNPQKYMRSEIFAKFGLQELIWIVYIMDGSIAESIGWVSIPTFFYNGKLVIGLNIKGNEFANNGLNHFIARAKAKNIEIIWEKDIIYPKNFNISKVYELEKLTNEMILKTTENNLNEKMQEMYMLLLSQQSFLYGIDDYYDMILFLINSLGNRNTTLEKYKSKDGFAGYLIDTLRWKLYYERERNLNEAYIFKELCATLNTIIPKDENVLYGMILELNEYATKNKFLGIDEYTEKFKQDSFENITKLKGSKTKNIHKRFSIFLNKLMVNK